MSTAGTFADDIGRFWRLVDKHPDGCWLWAGETNNHGYGRFSFWGGDQQTRVMAHRMMLMVHGIAVDGYTVLHSCDNPPCVNPSHLTIGTQAENIRDAIIKGRSNVDGLTAESVHICRRCGCEFLGRPNRRYCDDHRIVRKPKVVGLSV